MKIVDEFKTFITRGNVVDMAVGVIIGGAFGKIVTSLVNDLVMPPLGLLLARVDFADLFVSLSGKHYASLAEAKAAGAPTINYGMFLNNTVSFLITAFVIFLMIKQMNRFQTKPAPPAAPATKDCTYCLSKVPLKATRCPNCTSQI